MALFGTRICEKMERHWRGGGDINANADGRIKILGELPAEGVKSGYSPDLRGKYFGLLSRKLIEGDLSKIKTILQSIYTTSK